MTTTENTRQTLAARLWEREGGHCVSSLVHTLAIVGDCSNRDAQDLMEQAFELSSPIEDWEEAARDNGYMQAENGEWYGTGTIEQELADGLSGWDDAAALCWDNDIEPYYREVFEHWIVSGWLADQLEAKGEKVDRDFAGLVIWARTTTGQSITLDHAMQEIAVELWGEGEA